MRNGRASATLTVAWVLLVGALSYWSFTFSPEPDLVAHWWAATAVATALLLVTRPAWYARVCAALWLALLVPAVVTDQGLGFSVGFSVVNLAEAVAITWLLTRLRGTRPTLGSWHEYRRWFMAISLPSVAAGVLVAGLLWLDEGAMPWRTTMWVAISHLSMLSVVLPVVMKWPRQRVRVSVLEVASHCALLGLTITAYVSADEHDAVAFLLLPLLMWAAARFTSQWANIELLASAGGILVLTAFGRGPFEPISDSASVLDIAASSQTFVAISGITAVAFSVAMCRLRDSLRRVREGELQLRELFDSASGTAFIATDLEGTITLFNPGAEQILGYTAEEVIGRATPALFHDPAELASRAEELGIEPGLRAITRPLEDGLEQDTRDWTYVCKDQRRITVSLSATAVRDSAGRPASYLAIVRDVSDRRAAEQALVSALDKEREANHRLHELDRAKSQFVSAVSHELRTPLTSIVGYTELLAEGGVGDLDPGQLDLVERIDRNGDRLLRLVEDLLTLARVEDGSFEINRVAADLRAPVRSGVEALSCAAAKNEVALRLELPARPVTIEGDTSMLERLVVNLVSNAVKFSAAGGHVDVVLRVCDEAAELSVSDTGMGIPVEEQDRLFERFFRSSLATRRAIQGTGLGLSIVRSIAEAHDGRMSVTSTPEVGTTFTFTVPLSAPGPVPAVAPDRDRVVANAYR